MNWHRTILYHVIQCRCYGTSTWETCFRSSSNINSSIHRDMMIVFSFESITQNTRVLISGLYRLDHCSYTVDCTYEPGPHEISFIFLSVAPQKLTDGIHIHVIFSNTRLSQPKKKACDDIYVPPPERSGGRIPHTNQLLNADHCNIRKFSFSRRN